MALQSSVTQFQAAGARGLVANAETRNLISRSLAASAVVLGFGEPVYRVTTNGGDTQCSADPTGGKELLGLTRRNSVLDPSNSPADTFAANDEVPVLTMGVMWVQASKAVTAGSNANFDTVARTWTDAAVAGNVIAVAGAEFDQTTGAAGLVKVRVLRLTA